MGALAGKTLQRADSKSSTMVRRANNRGQGRDDIRHIIIRNVRGYSVNDHIVRFVVIRNVEALSVPK